MGNKMCMPLTKCTRPKRHDKRLRVLSLPPAAAAATVARKSALLSSRKITKPTFECGCCAHQRPLAQSFGFRGCNHFYCSECIVMYVKSRLDENVLLIQCPERTCGGVLELEDCRPILPEALFERWGNALCESGIEESEKFFCPYNNCSALMIIERLDQDLDLSLCPNCRRDICVKCKAPWHTEFTCKEFQRFKKKGDMDAMMANVAKKNHWKRCPSCKYYVSKSYGCQYIICRCGQEFCYRCGTRVEKNHCCRRCDR